MDFAVMIGSKNDYDAVRTYLSDQKQFLETKNNSFVMISPSGVEVDILPFGGIEIDDEVKLSGTGLTGIKVNGFKEVYDAGTEEMTLLTGHNFKVATLPAIVLLKLIAYDDRPEWRLKDAQDIVNVIGHFFDLQTELIYEHHYDVFDGEEKSLNAVSAMVIGREMKKISSGNAQLQARLITIITTQIDKNENSPFVRQMVSESRSNVEEMVKLLQNLLEGFRQQGN